jgi:hypothetical protein
MMMLTLVPSRPSRLLRKRDAMLVAEVSPPDRSSVLPSVDCDERSRWREIDGEAEMRGGRGKGGERQRKGGKVASETSESEVGQQG